MNPISDLLTRHHETCDDAFLETETAVSAGDRDGARLAFDAFAGRLSAHLDAEETVLFPAVQSASAASRGPVTVMCAEHGQMRELVRDLADAVTRGDAGAYASLAELFLALSRQHNLKEERILYPLCDAAMPADAALLAAMRDRLGA
jgi:hemerythrin-like domain-containing protein